MNIWRQWGSNSKPLVPSQKILIPLCKGAQEADKTSKEALSDRAFVAFTKHQESLIIKQERDGARYEMLMNSRHF